MPSKRRRTITYHCNTVDEVIIALGGISAVAELTERGNTAVHNWISLRCFSARVFEVMNRKLKRKRLRADPALWRQEGNLDIAA